MEFVAYIVAALLWAMLSAAITALRKRSSHVLHVFILNFVLAPFALIWVMSEMRRGVFDVFGDRVKSMPDEIQ